MVVLCLCVCSFMCLYDGCDMFCGVVWFVFVCCVCLCLFFCLKKHVLCVIDYVILCDVVWVVFFLNILMLACVQSVCVRCFVT